LIRQPHSIRVFPDSPLRATGDDRHMRPKDLVLLAIAVILMLGGAVTLVAGWVAAGIAIPLIAVGIAIVAMERGRGSRQHGGHASSTR
jgi:hypothetical protein